MKKSIESFNLINYLKIIDLSLLNLFDYIDLNESNEIIESNDRLILNFNSTCKKLLEGFVINNINNESYYGKVNILVNTCKPVSNWRTLKCEKLKKSKIFLIDDSIYIDEIKLNTFTESLFKRLPSLNATLNKKSKFQPSVTKSIVSIQKNIKFLELPEIDQFDLYIIIEKLLSGCGCVNKDNFKYNIIGDINCNISHDGNIRNELFDEVHRELMKKEII